MDPNMPGPMEPEGEGNPTGPDEDTEKYVEGLDYPAAPEDVASAAQSNGAPQALVERIRSVDREQFSSVEDVLASL